MPVYRHLKSFAKFAVGKGVFRVPLRSFGAVRYGDLSCGWEILGGRLSAESVVYCYGIGENVTFELDVARRHGCMVFAFDPTPKALKYVAENVREPRLVVSPYALSDRDCRLEFYFPADDSNVSCSTDPSFRNVDSGRKIEVDALSLRSCMEKFGHTRIDLLKMDIEGEEIKVFEDIFAGGLIGSIDQICVEFHHRLRKGLVPKVKAVFRELESRGVALVYAAANQEEFTFARMPGRDA